VFSYCGGVFPAEWALHGKRVILREVCAAIISARETMISASTDGERRRAAFYRWHCLRELKCHGFFLVPTGRGQIVASYLGIELRRTGALGGPAWFEQQLVDYRVASNWGATGAYRRGGDRIRARAACRNICPGRYRSTEPGGDYVPCGPDN